MKLISGSILTGFSILSLVFRHLKIGDSLREAKVRPDLFVRLDGSIEALIIVVMLAGFGLIIWGLIEQRKAKS